MFLSEDLALVETVFDGAGHLHGAGGQGGDWQVEGAVGGHSARSPWGQDRVYHCLMIDFYNIQNNQICCIYCDLIFL